MASYLIKWRLLAQTAPYAGLILLLKVGLIYLSFDGLIALSEIRIIFTSGIFLTGFMLAGTLADYKESERIPGRIASLLEGLEEMSVTLAMQAKIEPSAIRKELLAIGQSINDWFHKRIDEKTLHAGLTAYNDTIRNLLKSGGAPPIIGRTHQYIFDLRSILTRTDVISRTGFLSTGYALLELILITITVLLLLTKFSSPVSMAFIVFFVELLYIYMYRLISDIDDPFEYSPDAEAPQDHTASTEVPIFPLLDYLDRLKGRI
ncbi:MAG: hypothetical protein AAFN74_25600 [Myxococcota bacterium]